ncbi:LPS translocon maturation chaperone LptM [Marinobacter salinexigens]|nr:lipoprotein [Marinobacter salinexigens]
MRAGIMVISALVLTTVLGGCGQKGPLYREHTAMSATTSVQAVDAVAEGDSTGDDENRGQ